MGSVGQRAWKLLAVKVGGLKKKSAIWPRPLLNQTAQAWLRPGSNLSQSLTDNNFAALWHAETNGTSTERCNFPVERYFQNRGWFIKNATGLVILLQKNIYSTFSTRFCYDWIIWDIKTSKDFVIHLGLPYWLILSIFKHFKQFIHKNFTKLKKIIAFGFWHVNFDPD